MLAGSEQLCLVSPDHLHRISNLKMPYECGTGGREASPALTGSRGALVLAAIFKYDSCKKEVLHENLMLIPFFSQYFFLTVTGSCKDNTERNTMDPLPGSSN